MSLFAFHLSVLLGVSACSPYALKGRVIEGMSPSVSLVSLDDPRLSLQEPGLADASLALTLDPDRLNQKLVGSAVSNADGHFAMSVDVAGPGVLMHDVELSAERSRFLDASGRFVLPGKKMRVLVVLPAGEQRRVDDRPLLERTLEEAQPFMRE